MIPKKQEFIEAMFGTYGVGKDLFHSYGSSILDYLRSDDEEPTERVASESDFDDKAQTLSGFDDPLIVSASADFVFRMMDIGSDQSSKVSETIRDVTVTPEMIGRMRDVFSTFTLGKIAFPIPEAIVDPLCDFIEKYSIIARYFAYGTSMDDDRAKDDVLDYVDYCAEHLEGCIYLWKRALEENGAGLSLNFDMRKMIDPAKPFSVSMFEEIARAIDVGTAITAYVDKGVSLHDLTMDDDLKLRRNKRSKIPKMPRAIRKFEKKAEREEQGRLRWETGTTSWGAETTICAGSGKEVSHAG